MQQKFTTHKIAIRTNYLSVTKIAIGLYNEDYYNVLKTDHCKTKMQCTPASKTIFTIIAERLIKVIHVASYGLTN